MNKLFTQLLEQRHITEDFLHPAYENLLDPFQINDMDKAVARVEKAIKDHEKIFIYGDYDVDGVTASTLMENALILAGVQRDDIAIMLPDRFVDGYGMSPRLIKRAEEFKASLVITVDCGSRNHEIIDELNTLKIDTIVTDHHECADDLPEAVAVINPKRKDYKGDPKLRDLAGVGVAFKFAQALVNKNLIPAGQEKWLLDLVLLGTICDNMLLTGENRILGFYGIKVLEKTRRPGLKELLRFADVKTINARSVGYQIGPRLNAAGRLETAELALNLLRTRSKTEAASLAQKLEALNKKRRAEQNIAVNGITAKLKKYQADPAKSSISDAPVIIEAGHWHEGIIGIIAGRLVDNFHKPAFVLTRLDQNIYKGSGRSFGDFSLAEALNYAKDTIISGGGHAAAAGVRLESKNLYAFREKINEYYRSLHLENQEKYLRTRPDLETSEIKLISLELIDDFKSLEPFGPGNEDPTIKITGATVLSARPMGTENQHLSIVLKGADGGTIKCVAFSAPEDWFNIAKSEEPHDFVIKPTDNEFRGLHSVEASLLDILPVETA